MAEAYLYSGEYREAEAQFRLYISNFIDSPFSIVAEIKMREARDKLKKASPPPLPEIYREMRPGLRAVQVMLFEGRDSEGRGRLQDVAFAGRRRPAARGNRACPREGAQGLRVDDHEIRRLRHRG